jgi:PBP1b-binding outer membrane lipoprotein LpoB
MKKLFALLTVCGFAFAFVACGGGATQEEAVDSTAVEAAPVDTTAVDTTAADTTAAQ